MRPAILEQEEGLFGRASETTQAVYILPVLALRDEVVDDVAVDVGEAVVPAGVAVGDFLVVEAHQVEHGGIHVVHVDAVLDG